MVVVAVAAVTELVDEFWLLRLLLLLLLLLLRKSLELRSRDSDLTNCLP